MSAANEQLSLKEGLMKVEDVKARLNCSTALVYALIESGELTCYRIGVSKHGGIRVSEEQLQAYLKNRVQQGLAHGQPTKHLRLD